MAERRLAYRIEAPGPGSGENKIEKDEAVDHRFIPAVGERDKALGEVTDEISRRHLAGEDESDRSGEQPDQQQRTANEFDQTRDAPEREQLQFFEQRDLGKTKEFGSAILQQQQRRHNAQKAQHLRRPTIQRIEAHASLLRVKEGYRLSEPGRRAESMLQGPGPAAAM